MLLSAFNLIANQTIVPVKDFWKADVSPETPKEDYVDTVDIVQPRTSGDYEETLRYYIKNGMTDEIENLRFEDYQGIVDTLGPSQLRSMKNSLIILNSMCLRAAISGGLDSETAYSLGELYVKRIENAQSILDLGKLSHIIKRDYCLRVKRLSAPQIENLYVLKASEYIQKNLYKKMTAHELAEQVGVTPEYLSLLFRQNLHISIPQYVAQQKVLEAKNYCDLPINLLPRSPHCCAFLLKVTFNSNSGKSAGSPRQSIAKNIGKASGEYKQRGI